MMRFTGNPFVDAGIAGMCAAAKVASPEELTDETVETAVEELRRIAASRSMFQRRKVAGTRETAFATSEMSVIFPNGPLSQASYKTPEAKLKAYRVRLDRKYVAFRQYRTGELPDKGLGI